MVARQPRQKRVRIVSPKFSKTAVMRPRRRPAAADPAGCACVKDDDICTDSIISGMSLTMTHSSVAVQKRLGAIRSTVRQRHGFRIVQELEEVMGRVRQVFEDGEIDPILPAAAGSQAHCPLVLMTEEDKQNRLMMEDVQMVVTTKLGDYMANMDARNASLDELNSWFNKTSSMSGSYVVSREMFPSEEYYNQVREKMNKAISSIHKMLMKMSSLGRYMWMRAARSVLNTKQAAEAAKRARRFAFKSFEESEMIANHQALQGACLEIRSVMDRSLRQLRSQGYKTDMEKAIKQFQAVVGVVDRKQEQLMKHEKSLVGKAKEVQRLNQVVDGFKNIRSDHEDHVFGLMHHKQSLLDQLVMAEMERDELALKCRHQQKQLRKHVGGVPGGEPRGQTIESSKISLQSDIDDADADASRESPSLNAYRRRGPFISGGGGPRGKGGAPRRAYVSDSSEQVSRQQSREEVAEEVPPPTALAAPSAISLDASASTRRKRRRHGQRRSSRISVTAHSSRRSSVGSPRHSSARSQSPQPAPEFPAARERTSVPPPPPPASHWDSAAAGVGHRYRRKESAANRQRQTSRASASSGSQTRSDSTGSLHPPTRWKRKASIAVRGDRRRKASDGARKKSLPAVREHDSPGRTDSVETSQHPTQKYMAALKDPWRKDSVDRSRHPTPAQKTVAALGLKDPWGRDSADTSRHPTQKAMAAVKSSGREDSVDTSEKTLQDTSPHSIPKSSSASSDQSRKDLMDTSHHSKEDHLFGRKDSLDMGQAALRGSPTLFREDASPGSKHLEGGRQQTEAGPEADVSDGRRRDSARQAKDESTGAMSALEVESIAIPDIYGKTARRPASPQDALDEQRSAFVAVAAEGAKETKEAPDKGESAEKHEVDSLEKPDSPKEQSDSSMGHISDDSRQYDAKIKRDFVEVDNQMAALTAISSEKSLSMDDKERFVSVAELQVMRDSIASKSQHIETQQVKINQLVTNVKAAMAVISKTREENKQLQQQLGSRQKLKTSMNRLERDFEDQHQRMKVYAEHDKKSTKDAEEQSERDRRTEVMATHRLCSHMLSTFNQFKVGVALILEREQLSSHAATIMELPSLSKTQLPEDVRTPHSIVLTVVDHSINLLSAIEGNLSQAFRDWRGRRELSSPAHAGTGYGAAMSNLTSSRMGAAQDISLTMISTNENGHVVHFDKPKEATQRDMQGGLEARLVEGRLEGRLVDGRWVEGRLEGRLVEGRLEGRLVEAGRLVEEEGLVEGGLEGERPSLGACQMEKMLDHLSSTMLLLTESDDPLQISRKKYSFRESDDYFELPRSKSLTYNLQLLRKAVRANQVSRGTYQLILEMIKQAEDAAATKVSQFFSHYIRFRRLADVKMELEIELADNIFSDSQDQQIESLKYLDILSNVAVEHDELQRTWVKKRTNIVDVEKYFRQQITFLLTQVVEETGLPLVQTRGKPVPDAAVTLVGHQLPSPAPPTPTPRCRAASMARGFPRHHLASPPRLPPPRLPPLQGQPVVEMPASSTSMWYGVGHGGRTVIEMPRLLELDVGRWGRRGEWGHWGRRVQRSQRSAAPRAVGNVRFVDIGRLQGAVRAARHGGAMPRRSGGAVPRRSGATLRPGTAHDAASGDSTTLPFSDVTELTTTVSSERESSRMSEVLMRELLVSN